MASPELAVFALNLAIVLTAYLSVYPRLAGFDLNRMSVYDLVASLLSLGIVGLKFWGSGYEFHLLAFEVNWFWYTLITYTAIELPVMWWYMSRRDAG